VPSAAGAKTALRLLRLTLRRRSKGRPAELAHRLLLSGLCLLDRQLSCRLGDPLLLWRLIVLTEAPQVLSGGNLAALGCQLGPALGHGGLLLPLERFLPLAPAALVVGAVAVA
jgi:hypothetical protein